MSLPEPPKPIDCLSSTDAAMLLELIHGCLGCTSEEEFTPLLQKTKELFSFDFAGTLFGRMDSSNDLVITHGINVSFPEEWLNEYLARNYFYLDIATKETFVHCRVKCWSYLTNNYSARVPKDIMSLNLDFGVNEAYMHGGSSFFAPKKKSMFCFAGQLLKPDRRTDTILEHLIPHLHLALIRIFDNTQSNLDQAKAVLSPREREVLDWMKHGKSSWDISIILGISERTVNYHVYNLMQKLEAVNRPQAVAAAIRLGLIDLC
ncbi:MAG: LuxR C-terminal-related transcriptional regulator [Syntrophotaleaceae bacterium]